MSTTSFSQFNFHPAINKAIELCGYQTPTEVQIKSIPVILEGKDIATSAQTGTGKTGAFVLPILQRLTDQPKSRKTQVLILTPTRELAAQITQNAHKYGKFLKFNIVSVVGGASYQQQIRALSQGVEIVVATPGRLIDHIENRRLDLSGIHTLVLDEADRMLDMGFIDDVRAIAKLTPKNRQTLLFSATLDNQLMVQVKDLLKDPARIDLSAKQLTAPKIQQEFYKVKHIHEKTALLRKVLEEEAIYKAIIFSATKVHCDRLADELYEEGFNAAALHGDLKQSARNRTVEKLRRGAIQFLVATDVAARGLDVSDVTHVINFDLPKFCEDYVHRIGRTGRAGKEGKAISFILPTEMKHVQKIERYIGNRIAMKTADGTPVSRHDGEEGAAKRGRGRPRPGASRDGRTRDRDERPARRDHATSRGARGDGAWNNSAPKRDRNDDNRFGSRDTGRSFAHKRSDASRPESARTDDRRFSARDMDRPFTKKRPDAARSESSRYDENRLSSRDGERSFVRKKTDAVRSESYRNDDSRFVKRDADRPFIKKKPDAERAESPRRAKADGNYFKTRETDSGVLISEKKPVRTRVSVEKNASARNTDDSIRRQDGVSKRAPRRDDSRTDKKPVGRPSLQGARKSSGRGSRDRVGARG